MIRNRRKDHTLPGELNIEEITTAYNSSKIDWLRISCQIKPFTAVLASFAYWIYFVYRLKCAYNAAQSISEFLWALAWIVVEFGLTSKHNLPFGQSLAVFRLVAEVTISWSNMERFLHCFPYAYEPHWPIRIIGNDVPCVDVFVTYCGEDIDVIQDTIRATCALDYPTAMVRVFVLDDGASTTLRNTIFSMQQEHPNLRYTSRKKPESPDYEAGNLNHRLFYSQAIGNLAEFVAGLDADVIVDSSWLRATIPHLLRDPKLGIVGPPQVIDLN